jgi:hypothetical protein
VAHVADLNNPLVISESRRISAPAHEIFVVLRDPRRHVEFDGSSMVRSSDAAPIGSVGDSFVMRMHNDDFGDYEMRNEVVEFIEDQAIAWAPNRHDVDEESWNHRWGWRLHPDGGTTEVTAYFDCSRVPQDARRILRNGEWGRPILERSLDRLNTLVMRSTK